MALSGERWASRCRASFDPPYDRSRLAALGRAAQAQAGLSQQARRLHYRDCATSLFVSGRQKRIMEKWVCPTCDLLTMGERVPMRRGRIMSSVIPRFTDKKARLILPARFASSAVLIEEVSETELRIRKAVILPEDEVPFTEERRAPLSDEDRDLLLSLLAAPPKANADLKKAAKDWRCRHG